MPLVLRIACESLRQTRAWQGIENSQPVALQPRIAALPEWRRAGQGQQVWQEVGHLVHEVDAQFVVIDADVNVHAADQQAPGRGLHFDGQGVIPVLLRLFLFRPPTERVG